MNIRGTDPTALSAVTDLFSPPAFGRKDSGQGFERALQPAPSSPPPPPPNPPSSPPPTRRDENRSSATASKPPATKQDKDQKPATAETADDPNKPVNSKPPQAENAATSDEQPAEVPVCAAPEPAEEDVDDQTPAVTDQITQAIAASQQQAQAQPVKDSQPTELLLGHSQEAEKPIAEVEPASEVPAGQNLPNGAGTPQVSEQAPVVIPAQATATEVQIAATVAAETTAQTAAAATESAAPAVQIGVPTTEPVKSPAGLPRNVAPASSPPVRPQNSAGDPNTTGRKSTNPTGTAPTTEPTATSTAVAATDAESDDHRERSEDPPGTQRQVPGVNIDVTTATPKVTAEAPAAPATTTDLPPADVSIATPPADSTPPPGATQQQAGTTSHVQAPVNPAAAIIQRLPAHALVRHTAEPQPDGAAVQIDSARFLQRVARAFESARDRGGEIRLRLSPPELGALRVEVTMQDQGMVARVEVETPEARAALIENLPALRERLAEQNWRLERFDVDLSQRESPQRGNEFPEQQSERQAHSQARQPRTMPTRQPITPTNTTQAATPVGMQDRRLNVIV